MPNRHIPFEKETWYHVYNRGFNKQNLFFESRDYQRFMNNIERYRKRFPLIEVSVWCLLPNHYHLLLRHCGGDGERTDISAFMQKIQQAYARFFDVKYKKLIKKGKKMPMFEGRFKALSVLDEAYMCDLIVYIEHNAVKHGIVTDIEDWAWRSRSIQEGLSSEDFDPFFD